MLFMFLNSKRAREKERNIKVMNDKHDTSKYLNKDICLVIDDGDSEALVLNKAKRARSEINTCQTFTDISACIRIDLR